MTVKGYVLKLCEKKTFRFNKEKEHLFQLLVSIRKKKKKKKDNLVHHTGPDISKPHSKPH